MDEWILQVGKPFSEARTVWDDRVDYYYANGQHTLICFFKHLTREEKRAFRKGKMHIALMVHQPIIFFLFKIEGLADWTEQSFSIHLIEPENQHFEEIHEKERILLRMVLVNADTGIVEEMRAVTFSHRFSVQFQKAMQDQLAIPFDSNAYTLMLDALHRKYPDVAMMVKDAQIMELAGSKQDI